MKILETERLYLRKFSINDEEHLFKLNLDEDVIKYTGDSAFKSVEEAKIFLENYNHYQLYGFGRWAVIDKKSEEFLGWCGLKFSEELNEVDLGFRFFRKYWNKGFATESSLACLKFGFSELNLDKIVGRAMLANQASIKVLEKIGMQFVAEINFELHKGVLFQIKKTDNAHSRNL